MRAWGQGLLAAVLLLAGGAAVTAAEGGPKVRVETGVLQGSQSPDHRVAVYRGIPFARPPVGPLRWRAPERVDGWSGVRQADRFGAPCMQPAPRGRDNPPSEDCLYLNVWTPRGGAGDGLPVMVWIYGGGFRGGAGSLPAYDGANLARKGVILVTLNYRLGKFGFLAHPQLTAESGRHASGDYGLMDQVAALKWVQRNIGAFGGDPRNVTVFGQSAGGHAVSYLTASPLAKGLFAKAIGQSAGGFAPVTAKTYFGHTLRPLALAEQSGLRLQAHFRARDIAALRQVPARDILAAPALDDDDMGWPTVDGYVLPDTVDRIFAEGRQNDVPTLVGYNSNEGASFAHDNTLLAFEATRARTMGPRAEDYALLYPAHDDVTALHASEAAARDSHFGWQTWTWARMQARTGHAPIWWFFFDVRPPIPAGDPSVVRDSPDWGAHHGAEIPYVFETWQPAGWAWSGRDRRLGAIVSGYWVNFAKTGDPNGAGLPRWSRFDPSRPARMVFDEAPSQRPAAGLEQLAFWDALSRQ